MCGLWTAPRWQSFFDGDASLVGAAMCPACFRGADPWPLREQQKQFGFDQSVANNHELTLAKS